MTSFHYEPNTVVPGGWIRPPPDAEDPEPPPPRAPASRWDTSRGCCLAAAVAQPSQHKQLMLCELLVATAVGADEAVAVYLSYRRGRALHESLAAAAERDSLAACVCAGVLAFVCGVKLAALGPARALAQPLDAPLFAALGLAAAKIAVLETNAFEEGKWRTRAEIAVDCALALAAAAVLAASAIKVRRRHWLGPDASENVELAQLRADGYAPAPEDGSGRGGAPAAAQTPARRPERRRSSIDFPDDDPFMSPDCLRMGD